MQQLKFIGLQLLTGRKRQKKLYRICIWFGSISGKYNIILGWEEMLCSITVIIAHHILRFISD